MRIVSRPTRAVRSALIVSALVVVVVLGWAAGASAAIVNYYVRADNATVFTGIGTCNTQAGGGYTSARISSFQTTDPNGASYNIHLSSGSGYLGFINVVTSANYAAATSIAANATFTFGASGTWTGWRATLYDYDPSTGTSTSIGQGTVGSAGSGNPSTLTITIANPVTVIPANHRLRVWLEGQRSGGTTYAWFNGTSGNNQRGYLTVSESPADSTPPTATLVNPPTNATINGTAYSVTGTATDNIAVQSWKVETAPTGTSTWTQILSGSAAVNNASFGTFNTTGAGYTSGSKYDFRLSVTDTANNTSTATNTGVTIDNSAPTTSVSTSPATANGDSGWFKGAAPTVALSATDPDNASNLLATYYKWDSASTYSTYAGSFLPAEGTHVLSYYSVDPIGNAEAVKTLTFKVDLSTTPPVLTTPLGTDPAPAKAGGVINVQATATDAISGVQYVAFYYHAWNGTGYNAVGTQIGSNQSLPLTGSTYGVTWDT
ncbi:MAG: hypothetical protein M1337_03755, partial [Actinobacteria bacterium]|nr:hypothetical protein [Actinomycetota bacterium]